MCAHHYVTSIEVCATKSALMQKLCKSKEKTTQHLSTFWKVLFSNRGIQIVFIPRHRPQYLFICASMYI